MADRQEIERRWTICKVPKSRGAERDLLNSAVEGPDTEPIEVMPVSDHLADKQAALQQVEERVRERLQPGFDALRDRIEDNGTLMALDDLEAALDTKEDPDGP